MTTRRQRTGWARTYAATGLVSVAVIIGGGAMIYMLRPRAVDDGEAVEFEKPFDASEFKWPTLIQHLNDGTLQGAVKTDEAVFILYYLKEMNAIFGDAEIKLFLDTRCFTHVYDAEMNARLQSMFWTQVIPTALVELGAVLRDERNMSEVLAERYPILADALTTLSKEVPAGTFDRLFILGNLPSILKAKAQQDAMLLFREHGCSSQTTRRVYANAVTFVKAYEHRAAE